MANNSEQLRLAEPVVAALKGALPGVAERTVAAINAEVPAYGGAALDSEMALNIEGAVEMALGAFLTLAADAQGADPATPLAPAVEAAYALGRGEARNGRPIHALLAAYRVGARVAWQDLSQEMVQRRVPAATIAEFAALVFAYIDQLSGSSIAGHTDELATTGRVRARYLERLGLALLQGNSSDDLLHRAERADWTPPATLTAVVLPSAQLRPTLQLLDHRTLTVTSDVVPDAPDDSAVLLVPDVERSRTALLGALHGRAAVAGPTRPWTEAHQSYQRARRAIDLLPAAGDEPVDTDAHLGTLVLGADTDTLHDLQTRTLAPFAELRPGTAERLTETLRSWLLHQGRRDAVAADLHVHPQTVRYRMSQVRDLLGDRLTNPDMLLELVVALAVPTPTSDSPGARREVPAIC
jgi:PucR C-terminal helix-turn-helix domain/GGDEF-like domain